MWLQHRLNIRIMLATVAIISCASCASNDAKEFREASNTFMGCSMEPPWPVELTSIEESGATFVRKDEAESPPFNFLNKEVPSWESLPHVQPESLRIERHPPFEIVHFIRAHPDETIDFDISATVIRRDNAELFLPSELSTHWEELLNSCLENMQSEEL